MSLDQKELSKLSIEELAYFLSPSSDVVKELKRRGVLRTKNIVGELGEYLVLIPSLAWGKTIDIVCFCEKLEFIFVKKEVTNK